MNNLLVANALAFEIFFFFVFFETPINSVRSCNSVKHCALFTYRISRFRYFVMLLVEYVEEFLKYVRRVNICGTNCSRPRQNHPVSFIEKCPTQKSVLVSHCSLRTRLETTNCRDLQQCSVSSPCHESVSNRMLTAAFTSLQENNRGIQQT